MKLTVKTLKGGKFTVEVEPSNTVAEAKGIIVSVRDSRLTKCDVLCCQWDRPMVELLAKDEPTMVCLASIGSCITELL